MSTKNKETPPKAIFFDAARTLYLPESSAIDGLHTPILAVETARILALIGSLCSADNIGDYDLPVTEPAQESRRENKRDFAPAPRRGVRKIRELYLDNDDRQFRCLFQKKLWRWGASTAQDHSERNSIHPHPRRGDLADRR